MNPILTKILLLLAAAACCAVGALVPGIVGTALGHSLVAAGGLALGLAFPELGKLTSKSNEAGFARIRVLAMLSGCALAFCWACAAFRSATVADAEADVRGFTTGLLKACGVPLIAESRDNRVRATCLAAQMAQQVETIVESPPPAASGVPAGGTGAE